MNDLASELLRVLEHARPPLPAPPVKIASFDCPKGLASLLSVANGFMTKRRVIRVFGTEGDTVVPSLSQWNAAAWKREYGAYLDRVLLFSDDIMGDQYGYRFEDGARSVVKFQCEGGALEPVEGGINAFIETMLDPESTHLLDWALIRGALEEGLEPGPGQHLAFRLPLSVGGERTSSNLAVESIELHLGTLSQISRRNALLSDGTPISRFDEEP